MEKMIETQIKNEISKFNETLFDLIQGIDRQLDLDEETFTIIENSNKLLIFCAVKELDTKKAGEKVSVIYNEDAGMPSESPRIPFGKSLAQYRRYYRNSLGECKTIQKKADLDSMPDEIKWSYQFKNFFLYQHMDGSYGLCRKGSV